MATELPQIILDNFPDLMIDHYKITGIVGEGGQGVVLALENGDEKKYNGKVIERPRLKLALSDPELEGILRGVDISKELNHPGIQKVREVVELDSQNMMVVVKEHAEGKSLAEIVEEKRHLTPEELMPILNGVLDAVGYLHDESKHPRAGVVCHRDIKPSNIIVGEDGHVTIIDMDTSKRKGGITTRYTRVGTEDFASPEAMLGHTSVKSDLYSVSTTAIYALLGSVPESLRDSRAHWNAAYQLPEFLPSSLRDVLEQMVLNDPSDRLESALEFKEKLGLLDEVSSLDVVVSSEVAANETSIGDTEIILQDYTTELVKIREEMEATANSQTQIGLVTMGIIGGIGTGALAVPLKIEEYFGNFESLLSLGVSAIAGIVIGGALGGFAVDKILQNYNEFKRKRLEEKLDAQLLLESNVVEEELGVEIIEPEEYKLSEGSITALFGLCGFGGMFSGAYIAPVAFAKYLPELASDPAIPAMFGSYVGGMIGGAVLGAIGGLKIGEIYQNLRRKGLEKKELLLGGEKAVRRNVEFAKYNYGRSKELFGHAITPISFGVGSIGTAFIMNDVWEKLYTPLDAVQYTLMAVAVGLTAAAGIYTTKRTLAKRKLNQAKELEAMFDGTLELEESLDQKITDVTVSDEVAAIQKEIENYKAIDEHVQEQSTFKRLVNGGMFPGAVLGVCGTVLVEKYTTGYGSFGIPTYAVWATAGGLFGATVVEAVENFYRGFRIKRLEKKLDAQLQIETETLDAKVITGETSSEIIKIQKEINRLAILELDVIQNSVTMGMCGALVGGVYATSADEYSFIPALVGGAIGLTTGLAMAARSYVKRKILQGERNREETLQVETVPEIEDAKRERFALDKKRNFQENLYTVITDGAILGTAGYNILARAYEGDWQRVAATAGVGVVAMIVTTVLKELLLKKKYNRLYELDEIVGDADIQEQKRRGWGNRLFDLVSFVISERPEVPSVSRLRYMASENTGDINEVKMALNSRIPEKKKLAEEMMDSWRKEIGFAKTSVYLLRNIPQYIYSVGQTDGVRYKELFDNKDRFDYTILERIQDIAKHDSSERIRSLASEMIRSFQRHDNYTGVSEKIDSETFGQETASSDLTNKVKKAYFGGTKV